MYIAIEGNIGAGKSTLAKAVAQEVDGALVLEAFEDHPHLKNFYDGEEVNPFELEKWFLDTRYQMLFKAQRENKILVSDFWFEKSMIFANINLFEKEKMAFAKKFYELQKNLFQPNLMVYIDSESDELEQSIKNRSREIEENISSDYLLEISTAYKKRMAGLKNARIITFNMHEIRMKPISETVQRIVSNLNLNY